MQIDPQEFYDWRASQPAVKENKQGTNNDFMSQSEAAQIFGVNKQTVYNWEAGVTNIPRMVAIIVKNWNKIKDNVE